MLDAFKEYIGEMHNEGHVPQAHNKPMADIFIAIWQLRKLRYRQDSNPGTCSKPLGAVKFYGLFA